MNGELADPALITKLEVRFGPLRPAATKPFSAQYRDGANHVLIKIYRVIDPAARQARELYALRAAPELGIRVPRVLDHGKHGIIAWTAIEVVPGAPLALHGSDDVIAFLNAARSQLAPLYACEIADGAGQGWIGLSAPTTSAFLANELSWRVRTLACWPHLRDHLRDLDGLPIVRLHGDVKPEHILAEAGVAVLVDWEACSRGPAVLDQADVAFRVIRDLTYADSLTPVSTAQLSRSEHHSVALAWRLTLWLDRRHDALTGNSVMLAERMARLPGEPDPIAGAARIMRDARDWGVQY